MAHLRPLSSAVRALSHTHHVACASRYGTRCISQTASVYAKKKGKTVDAFEDGFEADDGDLFGSNIQVMKTKTRSGSTVKTKGSKSTGVAPTRSADTLATKETPSDKLTSEDRLTRFNALYRFISERIAKEPIKSALQVRTTAWTHLFGLATSKQQMEKLVKLFPLWRDAGRAWTPQIAENFVRRCEELACPQLALQVFTDHPKYGLDLATLPVARRLLHSLHVEHPLADTITASALYKIYNLPPLSTDLISCAMLASACFKNNTPESVAVANGLVPSLRQLLENTPPQEMALPAKNNKALRAQSESKEKAWLAWTLAKIETALEKQGQDFAWLREWRTQSGHLQAAA